MPTKAAKAAFVGFFDFIRHFQIQGKSSLTPDYQ